MSERIMINPRGFAYDAKTVERKVSIATLSRLHDLLDSTEGFLHYQFQGSVDSKKRPTLFLKVEGQVSLLCQRCLERLSHSLNFSTVLTFVADENALTQEEMEEEWHDFLPLEEEVDLMTLLQDELILSLPSVPRHAECDLPGLTEAGEKVSPFSSLSRLKTGQA